MTEDFVPTTRLIKNVDLSDGKAIAVLFSSSCGSEANCLAKEKMELHGHDWPQGGSACTNKEGEPNASECTFTPICSLHETVELSKRIISRPLLVPTVTSASQQSLHRVWRNVTGSS